jgi:hypothetical protein
MSEALQPLVLLILLLGFFLFSLGLYETSLRLGSAVFRSVDGEDAKSMRAVYFALGIIGFAGLCNAILLVPSLAEVILRLSAASALALHRASLLLLMAVVVALSVSGLLGLASRFPVLSQGLAAVRKPAFLARWFNGDSDPSALFFLSLALSTYLFNSIRGDYVYDSGLYHFPLINHGREFGLEIGLANLHTRYAYYNILNFGQIALQAFSPNAELVSPSLNQLFLAIALMSAYDAIKGSLTAPIQSFSSLGILSYWSVVILFGITGSASIISFDADFSLAIATSVVLYHCLVGGYSGRFPCSVLFLLVCLPLLKLAGVVSILFATVFGGVLLVLSTARSGWHAWPRPLADRWRSWPTRQRSLVLSLLAGLYALLLITSVILSGYAIYPQPQTGPIGRHAIDKLAVKNEKDLAIMSWARQGLDRTKGDNEPIPARTWIPQFLRTRRGATLLLWISSSGFISFLATMGCLTAAGRRRWRVLAAFSLAAFVASLAVLLVLPPDPRFYAWLRPVTFFTIIHFLFLAPVVGVIAVTIFTTSIATFSHQPLASMKPAKIRITSYPSASLLPFWQSRARSQAEPVTVNSPLDGDQCWNVAPPCSPSGANLLRNANKKNKQ